MSFITRYYKRDGKCLVAHARIAFSYQFNNGNLVLPESSKDSSLQQVEGLRFELSSKREGRFCLMFAVLTVFAAG